MGIVIVIIFISLLSSFPARAETWQELRSQADSLMAANENDSAMAVARRALDLTSRQYGGSDTASASVLSLVGELYAKLSRYTEAEPLYKRSLEIWEKAYGPSHPYVALANNNLGMLYDRQARFAEAESLYIRALEIKESIYGADHTEVAISIYNLAVSYNRQARYVEAEPLYRRALSIWELAYGPENPTVAAALGDLALLYDHQARFAEAEPLYKRSLQIREKTYGPDHPDVARSLNYLAMLYNRQARFAEAEPLCKRALEIREKILGPEHTDVALSLNNLAMLFYRQARYAEAEPLYLRALEIAMRAYGPEHPEVATSIHNLGLLRYRQARFVEAEALYKKALGIREKAYKSDHPRIAVSLGDLAVLYYRQARYAEAERLYTRVLEIREKTYGPEHPEVAATLHNLARLHDVEEQYAESELLYKRALAIRERSYGPDHLDVALSLDNLAMSYYCQARYAEAEPLYKRALQIREKTYGSDHPDVAATINNLAQLYDSQGRLNEAETLYTRTILIRERLQGSNHPDVASTLSCLSRHYQLAGLADSSLALQQKATEIYIDHFVRNAVALSETNMLSFGQKANGAVDFAISCYMELKSPTPEQTGSLAEIVLKAKGVIGDAQRARFAGLSLEHEPATLGLVAKLISTRDALSRTYAAGPKADSPESYRTELDSLSWIVDGLESKLYLKSESFRKLVDMMDESTSRIESALPPNSSVIEYYRWEHHPLHSDSTEAKYLAIILNHERPLNIVNLGNASVIDSLVSQYRKHTNSLVSSGRGPTKKDRDQCSILGKSLHDKIWHPLKKNLLGTETVFVCPDGELNLIAFAALIDEQEHYLVENLTLHYLSAARDLLWFRQDESSGSGLLAIGDPDFNASISARISKAPLRETVAIDAGSPGLGGSYNYRSACQDLQSLTVSRLPYTRDEVSSVTSIWAKRFPDSVFSYMDALATEDRFKKEARGKRVIHLATHGYFLGEGCNPRKRPSSMMGEDKFIGENPLLLSGLLFAGANLHGTEADSAKTDDGILSAYELQGMDLTGTDLVVLSACESGLGVIHRGEGVFGLRRAFQLAGVRTIVSALWRVQDKTTQEMMTELYSLMESKSIPVAMRELQLRQLAKLRDKGIPDHPLLWAPFVQIGDWR